MSQNTTARLHSTITLFFILNITVSLCQLVWIMWDAGNLNPFTYQGMNQKYFMGTGDLITGITFDISVTNALLSAFGVVYFLYRFKTPMVLLCMAVMLLTGSNFTDILLLAVLLFLFIFKTTRDQKSILLVCFLLMTVFMLKVSPENDHYIIDAYKKIAVKKRTMAPAKKDSLLLTQKPDSILNPEQVRQKIAMLYLDSLNLLRRKNLQEEGIPIVSRIKPSIPLPNIHTAAFQRKKDTAQLQRDLLAYVNKIKPEVDSSGQQIEGSKLPGKLKAYLQTFHYLKHHPKNLLLGAGMGNFSSKLAFRATGLQVAGGYPEKWAYANPEFINNHLILYLSYFSRDKELHSITNSPNAVFDQLLGEYGLAGILAFVFLYLAFFVNKIKRLTYGIPLLLLMLGAFCMEYWYEQLSIVILFELLMLVNIKETKATT